MKTALITGITGQTGSYLAELLLEKGYVVHGLKRRTSLISTDRIDPIFNNSNFHLHYGDLADGGSLTKLVNTIRPDEIYNLGAMSHVKISFEIPEYTADVVAVGALRLIEAVRNAGLSYTTKIYQASSSEMFGKVQEIPQKETTPFYPRSPYAVAKVFAHQIAVNYRESYGMYICNGILFNHESPRRGETFVTRKITLGIGNILAGKQDCIYLGNMNAERDWGHARDYAEAMWLMMQQDKADDYVIATGVKTSVKDFVKKAFAVVGIEVSFFKFGLSEVGVVVNENPLIDDGRVVVRVDEKYYRPAEVDLLLGDSTKARSVLNWAPRYDIDALVKEMVEHDIEHAKKGQDIYSRP